MPLGMWGGRANGCGYYFETSRKHNGTVNAYAAIMIGGLECTDGKEGQVLHLSHIGLVNIKNIQGNDRIGTYPAGTLFQEVLVYPLQTLTRGIKYCLIMGRLVDSQEVARSSFLMSVMNMCPGE